MLLVPLNRMGWDKLAGTGVAGQIHELNFFAKRESDFFTQHFGEFRVSW